MRPTSPALAALAFLVALPAGAGGLPEAIEAELAVATDACTAAGGTASVGKGAAMQADLDGNGSTDWVTNRGAVVCTGAQIPLCEDTGCLVTVWLGGETGPLPAWSSPALGVRIEGRTVVPTLAGALCDPPRETSCEMRLTFADTKAAPSVEPAAAPSDAVTTDATAPDAGDGAGPVESADPGKP